MSLEIEGTLIQKLPVQSGLSKSGNSWQKQEFIIETHDQYPKKICIMLWGDKANMLNTLNINDNIKVYFDIESREFNGKWYTDARAWKVEAANVAQPTMQPVAAPVQDSINAQPAQTVTQPANATMNSAFLTTNEKATFTDESDDLPF